MWTWIKSLFVTVEHDIQTAVDKLHAAADTVKGLVSKAHAEADALIAKAAAMKAVANSIGESVKGDAYDVKAKIDAAVNAAKS